MNKNDDDLLELQNYMKNKYNIDVKINVSKNLKNIKTIEDLYINLFVMFILLIVFIIFVYFLSLNKKFNIIKKKYLALNILFYVLLIFIFLLIIYYLQKYLFKIYFYNKNIKMCENNSINLNNIDFNTGDILQGVANSTGLNGILLYLFNIDFLHNIFVFKFKNENYILHFCPYESYNYSYTKKSIRFNSTYLEIARLENYLNDTSNFIKYYRLFKYNKKLENDKIFNFLKNLNMEKLNFKICPCIKDCDNNYNCMSFILNNLNIIPKFNINNFIPDNLVYLENISNYSYNKPIIIKV